MEIVEDLVDIIEVEKIIIIKIVNIIINALAMETGRVIEIDLVVETIYRIIKKDFKDIL